MLLNDLHHINNSLQVTQDVMVRIHATGSMIGIAFAHLFERFGWNRVVMLTSVTYCDMGARGISNEFTKQVYIYDVRLILSCKMCQ